MSKSRVNTYQNCPYNFYLQYIRNFRDQETEPEEGSPLKKGVEIHKIFEDYYELPAAKSLEEPYEDSIFKLLRMFPLSKKAHLEDQDPTHQNLYHKINNYQQLEDEYKKHLSNFAAFNAAMISRKGVENYIPQYRELTLYNSEENFLGIIDRAEEREDGTFCVVDYKTGRPGTLKKYLIELGLYKWLFEEETGKEVSAAGIYFSENGKLRTTELNQEDVERSLSILHKTRDNIKANHFPRSIGFLCNYCSNRGVCDLDLDEVVD